MGLPVNSLLRVLVYLFVLGQISVDLSDDHNQECFCFLESLSYDNETVELLNCQRKKLIYTKTQTKVQCQQVRDLVRVGPISPTNLLPANLSSQPKVQPKIVVANRGFADLTKNPNVRRLQLSLDILHRSVDAMAMAGLESLEELLARTSQVNWDSCSLANMIQLKQATLNCRSTFNDFLTFGSKLETLRFVNCEGVALQFHCVTCIQDVGTKVVRIRPGPPLNSFMVRFTNIQTYNAADAGNRLLVGQCLPGVCSDEMMCRNNVPFQHVRDQWTTLATFSSTENPNSSESTPQSTNAEEESVELDVQENSDKLLHATHNYGPRLTDNVALSTTSGRLRYWIVTAILSVTLVFLVATCVFISLYKQRLKPNKSIGRINRSELVRLNGDKTGPAVSADTLSLPDVI